MGRGGGADTELQCDVNNGWQPYCSHCYLMAGDLSWSEAEKYCVNHKAHLASVHSEAELDFLTSKHQNSSLGIPENSRNDPTLLHNIHQSGFWGGPNASRICVVETYTKSFWLVEGYVVHPDVVFLFRLSSSVTSTAST
uniref:C-type lectin domain-containing protein n=1 Tax=Hippocampus comes TaxID=109280 RepID=A0A3Q3DS38_HIPCM